MHPFSVNPYPYQHRRGLEPIPGGIGARGGIHPGQVTSSLNNI